MVITDVPAETPVMSTLATDVPLTAVATSDLLDSTEYVSESPSGSRKFDAKLTVAVPRIASETEAIWPTLSGGLFGVTASSSKRETVVDTAWRLSHVPVISIVSVPSTSVSSMVRDQEVPVDLTGTLGDGRLPDVRHDATAGRVMGLRDVEIRTVTGGAVLAGGSAYLNPDGGRTDGRLGQADADADEVVVRIRVPGRTSFSDGRTGVRAGRIAVACIARRSLDDDHRALSRPAIVVDDTDLLSGRSRRKSYEASSTEPHVDRELLCILKHKIGASIAERDVGRSSDRTRPLVMRYCQMLWIGP